MAFSGPRIKLRANVRIPARVVPGPGISQGIANGTLTTGLNITPLTNAGSITSPSSYQIFGYNTDLAEWQKITLNNVPTTTTGDSRTARGDANYIILDTDRYVGLTATLTTPRTWSLPAASSVPGGTRISVNDEAGGVSSTNTLTFTATGADTINGASSFVLDAPFTSIVFRSNGSNAWSAGLVPRNGMAPRIGAALSVVGRGANSTGAVADITAGTSGYVLRRSGTTLAFGQIDDTSVANGAITTAKLADQGVTLGKLDANVVQGLCKSWLSFNGTGTVSIRDSFNVTSIVDNGAGDYSINTNAFPSVNYGVVIGVGGTSGVVTARCLDDATPRVTTQYRFNALNTTFAAADATQIACSTFGD